MKIGNIATLLVLALGGLLFLADHCQSQEDKKTGEVMAEPRSAALMFFNVLWWLAVNLFKIKVKLFEAAANVRMARSVPDQSEPDLKPAIPGARAGWFWGGGEDDDSSNKKASEQDDSNHESSILECSQRRICSTGSWFVTIVPSILSKPLMAVSGGALPLFYTNPAYAAWLTGLTQSNCTKIYPKC